MDAYRTQRVNCGDPWWLVIEQAVEIERLKLDPTLPSRWRSAYLFPTLNDAMLTLHPQYFGMREKVIWTAEFVDKSAKTHIGNADLFNPLENLPYSAFVERARNYWRVPQAANHLEVIAESAVRLLVPVRVSRPDGMWYPVVQHSATVPTTQIL